MNKIDRRSKNYIPRKFGATIFEDANVAWEKIGKGYKFGCTCDSEEKNCKHIRLMKKLLRDQEQRIYIKRIPAGYSCGQKKGQKRKTKTELLISNFKLPPYKNV